MLTNKIAENIVQAVNNKTGLELTFDKIHDHDRIIAKLANGNQAVIVGYGNTQIGYFIRSVVTRKTKRSQLTWLCNGQAGNGAKELAYWDEGEFTYQFNKEEIESIWQSLYFDNWPKLLASGAIKYPSYLVA